MNGDKMTVQRFDGSFFQPTEKQIAGAKSVIRAWSMLFSLKGNNELVSIDAVYLMSAFANVRSMDTQAYIYILIHWDYIRDYHYPSGVFYKLSLKAISMIRGAKK